MQDSLPPSTTDKACLISIIMGGLFGLLAALFKGTLESVPMLAAPPQIQLILILTLSLLAGLSSALVSRKHFTSRHQAPGVAGRLGIRTGLFCAIWAGAILTLLAALDANTAETAALDRSLRERMWLVFAISLASFLPGVLCGFAGGLIGGQIAIAKWPHSSPTCKPVIIPWLRWAEIGIAGLAVLALASPAIFLGRAPVVDPPPVVIAPPVIPSPPPFHYEPPSEIKSAKIGEIQPDFTKVIPNVQSSSPVALSPDGTLIAFGDSSGVQPAVVMFDLHRFSKIASISVPSFPHGILGWSPDQKSIACTIGEGQSRRIWILKIAAGTAIELPRPPGRDVPGGDLFWWQDQELVFFPDDEAPLAFDLQKLLLSAFVDSPHYKKLDEATRKRWMEGPRAEWPGQSGWKLGLRTLLTSATPPMRRNPETPWEFSGGTICAYEHSTLPLAYGIRSLGVKEDDHIFCSLDGSKIAHLSDGQIEVTYMKKASCPDLMIEVEMPQSSEEITSNGWKSRVVSKELCLMICAPLKNPLNQAVVGPDYQHIRALARLHEWKGRKAVFIVPTYDGSIQPDDVASTLHSWYSGKISEWKAPGTQNWWAPIQFISSPLPDKLPELELPQLLSFEQESSSLRVTKAVSRPRPTPASTGPELPTVPRVVMTEQDVQNFLKEHHAKASRGDVAGMIEDYDPIVDFLDKGRITQNTIEIEERAHRQKWPKGSEQVVGTIQVSGQLGGWSAAYTMEFYNENAAGEWHKGRADLVISLKAEGRKLSIISQRAKIYDVTKSQPSAPKTPAAAPTKSQASKGGPITVPRPCFVTVTRARDLPQIEFTDQISFVNGIVWHRTYRELSPDGKVLRTCRAIYTGNGGVAPDRSSARIYVGAQEWDRVLGGGTFTGVCSRSAASLVGKAFEFQFVTGGMVESQLGMVFQLQK